MLITHSRWPRDARPQRCARMSESSRSILEMLTAAGGACSLFVIGKQVRSRFWRSSSTGRDRGAEPQRRPRDYAAGALLAFVCALLWALSYVTLKFVSGRVAALPLTAGVIGSAALFLVVGQSLARRVEARRAGMLPTPSPRLGERLGWLCLACLGNFGFSIAALYFISATHAMALNNVSPLFLSVLLVAQRKLRITFGSAVAVTVVLLGAWLLSQPEDAVEASFAGSGLALAAGASFAWWAALADDIEARIDRMSARIGVLVRVFGPTFAVAASAAWWFGPIERPSLSDALIVIGNGLRVAIVCVVFQLAVRRGGPLLAVVVGILQVPLTLLSEALWFGVTLDVRFSIGVAAAVVGTIALSVDQAQQSATGPRTKEPHAQAG